METSVTVLSHPLVQHKLGLLRSAATPSAAFRRLAREIAMLMACEVTRDLALETVAIDTPLERMQAPRIAGPRLALVSILRAGNGLLDGMLDVIPDARVGHVGLFRDAHSLQPVEYYLKLPEGLERRLVILLDPMLATGGSAAAAVARLKRAGAVRIRFACLLAAPEGLARLHAEHPDVAVWTASIDRELDEHGYIRPGLGDAGDRLYGTDQA